MDDVAEWLPEFLKRYWDQAVDSLRSEGQDIVTVRTEIWPAHDPKSGGIIDGIVRCKVYESGDQTHTRVTHGDLDKDVEQTFSIDLQSKDGGRAAARRRVHEAAEVIFRVLELHRRNPHPDWNEVSEFSIKTVNNYADYQQRVVNLTLRRYGVVLPAKVAVVDTP